MNGSNSKDGKGTIDMNDRKPQIVSRFITDTEIHDNDLVEDVIGRLESLSELKRVGETLRISKSFFEPNVLLINAERLETEHEVDERLLREKHYVMMRQRNEKHRYKLLLKEVEAMEKEYGEALNEGE